MMNLLTNLVMLWFATNTAYAQTFNTIDNTHRRYKVTQSATPIYNKEILSEDSISHGTLHTSEPVAPKVEQKEKEQTRYPLSVSYPLRQSKLKITSPYGWRIHPTLHQKKFHAGVDLSANYEPIYAMLPGEVMNVGYEPKGGNFISLKHGSLKVTYCHLSVIGVKKGAMVYAGEPIGVSGNSGQYTTGPHLHLGVKDITTNRPISAIDLLNLIDKMK